MILVPGLHTQQNAESIGTEHKGRTPEITSNTDGSIRRVTNSATIQYLQSIRGKNVVVDVWPTRSRRTRRERRRERHSGPRGKILQYEDPPTSRISALLYAMVPLITLTAIILMILGQDWWGFSTILCLIVARALNVYVIKGRTHDTPPFSALPNTHQIWWIALDDNYWVCMRGLRHDLEAIATGIQMRDKSQIQENMVDIAKIIVFLVAVFSGNMTQAGNIILMILLLSSAGLLAMSNAFASTFEINGRLVYHRSPAKHYNDSTASQRGSNAPNSSEGDGTVVSDFEKQEAQVALKPVYPFNDKVNYV
jgi:hypothetical protein